MFRNLFRNVVVIIFESVFHPEIYQNNILLLFLKKYF